MTEYDLLMTKKAAQLDANEADADDEEEALETLLASLEDAAWEYDMGGLDKSTVDFAAKALKRYEKLKPLHVHTGIYGPTADTWAAAKENLLRGNYVRGLLGAAVRTPLRAAADTVTAPLTIVDRASVPGLNTWHMSAAKVQSAIDKLPEGKIKSEQAEKLLNALEELSLAAATDREDPTDPYAATKDRLNSELARGGSNLPLPANPALYEAFVDTAMLPVTAPAKILGLQGTPREEYARLMSKAAGQVGQPAPASPPPQPVQQPAGGQQSAPVNTAAQPEGPGDPAKRRNDSPAESKAKAALAALSTRFGVAVPQQ